ncbi:MAG: CoA transferase, partial [Chloroflexi bacterium]|nr:CoA transferase [Chloroflexota bacterium]
GPDSFIAIAVTCDQEWQALARTVGEPWCRDGRFQTALGRWRHQDELDRLLEGWTFRWRATELMALLQAAGVPAGVVESPEDVHADPQLAHRGHFWYLEHPEIGRHAYDGPAFRLSRTPGEVRAPAPLLGQHNEQVFVGLLGMADQEFAELVASGALE